jgi:excisionase family DNA binding protein
MQALKTIPEAAELLRISHWTVRKAIKDGKLIPIRLGRRVCLEEEELERFVAERKGVQSTECEDMCARPDEVESLHQPAISSRSSRLPTRLNENKVNASSIVDDTQEAVR